MSGLSDKQLAKLPSNARDKLLHDGGGLYLRVRGNSANWQYRFSEQGKRRFISLGLYPQVSLINARQLAQAFTAQRKDGEDMKRNIELVRIDRQLQAQRDFESIARRWHTNMTKDRKWSKGYAGKVIRHFEIHLFPWLGGLEIDSIHPTELVRCLHRIKDRGTLETAQRVREVVQQVFSYAVDIGVLDASKNFVTSRTGALPSPRARHYAAILEPEALGQLLRNVELYNGNIITKCALRLAPMLFQRPGQLRTADWSEIDLEGAMWTCPAKKMKLREWQKRDPSARPHKVPLPRQAVTLLRELHELTGPHGAVFKSVSRRSEPSRYLSENTLNAALRALGYDTRSDITTHGFRATARTLIREKLKWSEDVIERHLAHVSSEELGSAYDRADFLEERREMVQHWADYLDSLRDKQSNHGKPSGHTAPPKKVKPSDAIVIQTLGTFPVHCLTPGEWRD